MLGMDLDVCMDNCEKSRRTGLRLGFSPLEDRTERIMWAQGMFQQPWR